MTNIVGVVFNRARNIFHLGRGYQSNHHHQKKNDENLTEPF